MKELRAYLVSKQEELRQLARVAGASFLDGDTYDTEDWHKFVYAGKLISDILSKLDEYENYATNK